jgi:hypothetical protein
MLINVRKKMLSVETICHDNGPVPAIPLKIGVSAIVIKNPYAGQYVEDLTEFRSGLYDIADCMAEELTQALGGASKVETYGKGAIVGVNSEIEFGALWHEPSGMALRKALSTTLSMVPSSMTVASAGYHLQIPLHHTIASYVRSHFLHADVGMVDSPRPDELLYAIAMSDGPRVHERIGGLRVNEISVKDGQR